MQTHTGIYKEHSPQHIPKIKEYYTTMREDKKMIAQITNIQDIYAL